MAGRARDHKQRNIWCTVPEYLTVLGYCARDGNDRSLGRAMHRPAFVRLLKMTIDKYHLSSVISVAFENTNMIMSTFAHIRKLYAVKPDFFVLYRLNYLRPFRTTYHLITVCINR